LKSPGNIRGTRLVEDGGSCAFTREVLTRIGDKWSVLVIVLLGDGTRRFSEIKRLIEGISQRMLTMTLRGLERDGLVLRAVFPTVPPRVEYSLTPLGGSLLRTVSELAKWASENRQEIERARQAFNRREAAETSHLPRHA
jgi:DNA-binding HxlR family transcriptional regulator